MKKTYNIFISLFFAFLLISCSQDELATDSTSTEVQISSSLSSEDYVNAIVQIDEIVRFSTRSSGDELTENDAISILQPFAKDGLVIRNQLISQKAELSLTPQDVSELEGMTDSQLAELSFAFMTICNEASAKGVSWGDIGDCLMHATGITDLSALIKGCGIGCVGWYVQGTKTLMTATAAKQIIKAFAKRTVGWVGVAWMIYDFADCMNSKKK